MTPAGASGRRAADDFYSGESLPVFALTVFAKGERADLTMAERNSLQALTRAIVTEYKTKVAALAKKDA